MFKMSTNNEREYLKRELLKEIYVLSLIKHVSTPEVYWILSEKSYLLLSQTPNTTISSVTNTPFSISRKSFPCICRNKASPNPTLERTLGTT